MRLQPADAGRSPETSRPFMLPNINEITENVLGGSVMFLPELLVCGTIVLLLLLRVLRPGRP